MRESPLPGDVASRLSGAKVGVAGLGGMGSHVAVALARSGIGTLVIADFDVVDGSNLFRQCYLPNDVGSRKTDALRETLSAIEPDIRIEVFDGRLDGDNAPEVFSDCEVVCECLDQADQKAMLVESLLLGTGCTVVSCSGMAGFGSSNEIVTRKRMRRLYVCGDGVSEASEGPGLTAARVMVCAGHVANMAIRLLLGEDKP